MNILVINSGSSSLKYQLIDMNTEHVLAKGDCDRIGTDGSQQRHTTTGMDKIIIKKDIPTHVEAVQMVIDMLLDDKYGVIKSLDEIHAVGHRVVHSGEFTKSVIIDDGVLEIAKRSFDLAPLHNPAAIKGAEACRKVLPGIPMTLVFDTIFHSTMPPKAFLYGLPYEAYTDWKVRKYGFHGTSHKFVSREAAKFLGRNVKELKMVTCHLGNGSSISAVDKGVCVDTSMGFTPLAGVCMGTRCGDIDPALVSYIMKKSGMNIDEMVEYMNKKSGMLGLTGFSSDFRDITDAMPEGNERAILAIDVFSYQIKKFVGAYIAAMNGIDALVFTAGVGEFTPEVRERVCGDMSYYGMELDQKLNWNGIRGQQREISTPASKVRILIIPTNEELAIARETLELVQG